MGHEGEGEAYHSPSPMTLSPYRLRYDLGPNSFVGKNFQ